LKILHQGRDKAETVASATVAKVYEALGLVK
jgi:hypothetical protein